MKNLIKLIRNKTGGKNIPLWIVLPTLLIVSCISFGLNIPFLGVYWDDWETLLVTRLYPVSEFWHYFQSNRPLAAWTYLIFAPILGASNLNWHLLALVLRWLSAVAMFWFLSKIWKNQIEQVAYTAFLFLIYPIFIQQPIAVSYHQHWIGFILYFTSMGLMVCSLEKSRKSFLFYTALALAGQLLHLMIFEYFVGIELLRPLVLWFSLKAYEKDWKLRLRRTVKTWLPYLLVMLIFTAWRLYFSEQVEFDPNRPTLLYQFFVFPLGTMRQLIEMAGKDLIYIIISCWYQTLQPQLIDFYNRRSIIIWIIVLFTAGGLFILLYKLKNTDSVAEQDENRKWDFEMFITGLAAVLLSQLPIWLTQRIAFGEGQNNDRFGMVAMFGASLIMVTLLNRLLKNRTTTIAVISVLVALAAGLNLRVGDDYRNSWERQKEVYWQLYWRAPAITPHTTFLSHGQLFPYVMPTFSFNLLYLEPKVPQETAYWFYLLERHFQQDSGAWLEGKVIREEYREFSYSADTRDSLILANGYGKCLWILHPQDTQIPELSSLEIEALPLSNLKRIQAESTSTEYPPTEIFGNEPQHNWCYFYQKAELARQYSQWDEIIKIAQSATILGYNIDNKDANSPYEWMPFIEAYAYTGNWTEALSLTQSILDKNEDYRGALLTLWNHIADEAPESTGMNEALPIVFKKLTESR